jgi:hypothetical protein
MTKFASNSGVKLSAWFGTFAASRGTETGYARRKFTFPGGEVHVLIANDGELADRPALTEIVGSHRPNSQP